MKSYTMESACETADEGTAHIEAYLRRLKTTQSLLNVEGDPRYQKEDIDLLWGIGGVVISVEIKVDNYFESGNYFFEVISNTKKDTPGCFMYSSADLLFYYFLNHELHVMDLKKVRKWFMEHRSEFRIASTSTSVNGNKYYTKGCLVPRYRLLEEGLVTVKRFE